MSKDKKMLKADLEELVVKLQAELETKTQALAIVAEKTKLYAHGCMKWNMHIRLIKIELEHGARTIKIQQIKDADLDEMILFLSLPHITALEVPCDYCVGAEAAELGRTPGWHNPIRGQKCFKCITGRLIGKLGVRTVVDQKGETGFESARPNHHTNARKTAMEEQSPVNDPRCGDCAEPLKDGKCSSCKQKAGDLDF